MALGTPVKVGVQTGTGGSPHPSSVQSRWIDVHGDATSQSSTPNDIASLTESGLFWCRVPEGATRILELRHVYNGTLNSGATVLIIGCDRMGDDDSPSSDAEYRTIASGIALGYINDVQYGGVITTRPIDNGGAGWDLRSDAGFLIVVTTPASVSAGGWVKIQAKVTN